MRHSNRWMVTILIMIVSLQFSACARTPVSSNNAGSGGDTSEAARVEHLSGTNLNRVILTAEADRRIGIQMGRVRDAQIGKTRRKVVPYAAVLYDLHGNDWVYTNPAPLTFVREHINVDYIDGDLAILTEGPPSGTEVVTVGTPELYGTEFQGGLEP